MEDDQDTNQISVFHIFFHVVYTQMYNCYIIPV